MKLIVHSSSNSAQYILPFKSIAVTLLFCVFLGPLGVLYSSVYGGIFLSIIGFIVISSRLLVPIIILWIISCIWGVIAANKYNLKLLNKLLHLK